MRAFERGIRRRGHGRIGAVAAIALMAMAAGWTAPRRAGATVSLGAWLQHSPDDISGFATLSGNDSTASVTLPFTLTIEGTSFTTLVLSTNGWIEFGANTFGTSDPANACLPTSKHTNPFLAAYWDDLNTFGTNVRYGTVGSSPHRVFIADYQVDVDPANEGGGADDMSFQIQIHEGSNLINVRYRGTGNLANGQSATIGFQGAGGASSDAQPLTCNGKIMDDNRPDEGWSVDVGRADLLTVFALTASSPDDITGFATLSGDSNTAGVTMPFSVSIEGTSYNQITIGTNGTIQFGTTSGANPGANTGLPTGSFSNPTLFFYWDDLQTEGNNIRYGSVGTSPNRTYVVDFQANTVAASGDKVNGQVQIHEGSGLINVKYRSTISPGANGQSATIGFQGAGGASASAYPLTFNGKVLDDDRPDEGWSVHPKALGAMSLHATIESSPNDLSGFATLSGNDATIGVTMPFSIKIDGTSYSTLTIGTNGLVQFGTLAGANPTGNTALPSSSFPNPTLFYYWDDLQTEGGNIRYGTLGTSPNRTFYVDFQENTVASSGNKVNGQVQIHEGSGAINVQYRSTLSAGSNGQSATIGFQGAGGASATAYPLTFNGKILDDNLPDSGWSVAPLPICGNSVLETEEDCDQGGSNGASTSCCTSTCGFRASGAVCRPAAGVCDLADTCTGASATCSADAKSTAVCRSAAASCDVAESCNGSGNDCPADAFQPASTVCRGSADVCDVAENCTGTGPTCPTDTFASSSVVCRGVADVCDVAENCTGSGAACPADAFQPSSTVCRGSAGVCDLAESCSGSGAACPADAFEPSSTVCRGAAGVCDLADTCTGSSAACPSDAKSTASCRASAGACDLGEICDGIGNDCPADAKSTAQCRAAAGTCDVAESCDGIGDDCPADAFVPATTVCRAVAGFCDVAENCTGSSSACPTDAFEPSSTTCRAAAGVCDLAETCTGSGAQCPIDAKSTATCRAAAGVCDTAEACDGSGDDCPADAKSTAECRAAADACDLAESCDGSGDTCPSDAFAPSSTVCRAAAGFCDVAENCTGTSAACPADAYAPPSTECRAAAGACDLAESCTGSGADCPGDAKSTAECRAVAGGCDLPESCDGSGDDCPADAVRASGFVCNAGSGDLCDVDETCDGSSNQCPSDTVAAAGTVCRAGSGDLCDPDEVCGGNADEPCPIDAVANAGTLCRPGSGDSCDPDETCSGSSGAPCPGDIVTPSATVCRAGSGDQCDPDESCSGTAGQSCPADTVAPPTTVCRPGSGDVCDPDELCPGIAGGTCAAEVVAPPTTVCRLGSGDACDPDEFCPGVPTGTCAADVVTPAGTVCNPGSGDVCDPDETCSGNAGQACPTDTVASSGTLCRAAAGVCDVAETCTGAADATCPADAKQSSSTVCRAAADACDAAETCTGSGDACPADAKQPDGTSCSDGLFCDGAETCASGACGTGTPPCTFVCNEGTDSCQSNVCPAAPQSCRAAQKSLLIVKNKADNAKDKLIWKWIKGAATTTAEFADPRTAADYALCIYAGASDTLVASLHVPANNGKWTALGTKGFKYLDPSLSADGTQKAILKGGAAGKAKAIVKGRGVNLPDPLDIGPLGTPVTAQLLNYQSGVCWEGNYTTAKKDTTLIFKAKQ